MFLLLLSEELQPATREKDLLAVLVLIDRYRAYCLMKEDLFDILTAIFPELHDGKVQNSIREAIFRRRSGKSVGKSLDAMDGIDPYLDEFILNLRLVVGSSSGPALTLILSRLQERVGQKWDETSRLVLLKNKTRLPVRFGRTALITISWVLLSSRAWGWMPGFLSRLSWIGLVGVAIGIGLCVYLIQTQKWARRILVILLLLLALAFYGNTLSW